MSILLFFLVIFIIIRITKLETKTTLLLSLIITYFVYSDRKILKQISSITTKGTSKEATIPDIFMKDWYLFWKDYLNDIREHNRENYIDVMKTLRHFQQIYLETTNGADIPNQRYENLALLQKEILNILHSTIYSLPVTHKEKLENILNNKLEFVKKELDYRLEEIKNYINNEWDKGNINYLSKPIYKNELNTLPFNYSEKYNFY